MDRPTNAEAEPLLEADEPAPFEVVNADGRSRIILTCDHASRRIPRRLGSLGVAPADLERHIAWDIGAAVMARRLSEILDAPLVLGGYSRLVVDCNRPLDRHSAFATVSEEVEISGNHALTAAERAARADAVYWPYHDAINQIVNARTAGEATPVLISVHSFTPVFHGAPRPWEVGILHRWDRRLADLILTALGGQALTVGDNQPYQVDLDSDYTIPVHAETRGIPHALLEVRQDLIAADDRAVDWAERLASILSDLLDHPDTGDYAPPAQDIREPRYQPHP